ncbi:pentapeptide repeat-containing protein [Acaryochloris marina]|uniref:pentapeptide repeat-containing protein n=1 Tax=Acaryochloris marina TaxID=155978 RepID=UPI001BB00A0C|nr:pentapeptide repeat-containing protein [Acaryochloris marina]QUY45640.1 pentapeptide repeat-containing protein [Acaryochloris marina S15]
MLKQRIEREENTAISREKLFQLENTTRENYLKIIQSFGGLGFLLTGYFAWRNLQMAEKNRELAEGKQVTERFSKAVELLSDSKKLEARIGGIYILGRIANDHPKDQITVMEVLTTFIREKSLGSDLECQCDEEYSNADIQSALNVIGRRNVENDGVRGLFLYGSNLSGVDLCDTNFSNTVFSMCDLSNAYLRKTKLINTNFSGTKIKKTKLCGAFFSGANLSGANLSSTDLSESDLTDADLSESDLSESDLTDADLSESNLTDAILSSANLKRANLKRADLRETKEITPNQIKQASNWEQAHYSDDFKIQLGLSTTSEESAEKPEE